MACDRPRTRRWADLRPTLAPWFEPPDGRAPFAFLDEAERAGFAPTVDDVWACYDAFAGPRAVSIIRRMREVTPAGRQQRWELMLHEAGELRASGFVLGFEATAVLAIDWLRGADEEALWTRLAPVSHHRTRNGASIEAPDAAATPRHPFVPCQRRPA